MDQEVEMSGEAKAKAKEVIFSAKQAVERLLKEAKALAGKLTDKNDDLYSSLTLCILSYCFVCPCSCTIAYMFRENEFIQNPNKQCPTVLTCIFNMCSCICSCSTLSHMFLPKQCIVYIVLAV